MKVLFDLVSQQITIDGDGPELIAVLQAAREIAPSISQIQITTKQSESSGDGGGGGGNGGGGSKGGNARGGQAPTTMKQFVRSLTLKNAAERIAAVGYYVKTRESTESFSPKEMAQWFTNCNLPKPAQMPVAMFDTKRNYRYVESAGHGRWRLTADGENIIVQRQDEVEAGTE